ncbi:hypothetical protein CCACVL1_02148 [Corchorus capsularis]|uniref:Uncharacterized protein n=1 Tax=Corchorus capsularis TaxID=210143 RepID=A0A1R3KC35_COCAP|nr:hypothetical protein CCACVL1_02148 [Corchorus capsularis]
MARVDSGGLDVDYLEEMAH